MVRFGCAILMWWGVVGSAWGEKPSAQNSLIDQSSLVPFDQLDDLVTRSDRTVDGFLRELPKTYRRYFTLIHRSQSLHQARPDRPRILFYGPTGKTLIAISGVEEDPNFDVVEVIGYDEERSRYRFGRIDFKKPKPSMVEDAQHCIGCHGHSANELRPNWEPYSVWPGVFGSLHDRVPQKLAAYGQIVDFMSGREPLDRYQDLELSFYKQDNMIYTLAGGVGTNSYLGIVLSFHNFRRIADLIAMSPDHHRYRPVLTAAMIGCEDLESFLTDEGLKLHRGRLRQWVMSTSRRQGQLFLDNFDQVMVDNRIVDVDLKDRFLREHADRMGHSEEEGRRVGALRFLLEGRKSGAVDMSAWSLSFRGGSYNFNDGINGTVHLIGHYLKAAYAADDPILDVIGLEAHFFKSVDDAAPVPYFHLPPENKQRACKALKEASRRAFASH